MGEEMDIAELERLQFDTALCKMFAQRNLCLKDCNLCKLNPSAKLVKLPGSIRKALLATIDSEVENIVTHLSEKYHMEEAVQGKLEVIKFPELGNLSDSGIKHNKEEMPGINSIIISNYMTDPLNVYVSQGEGIKTLIVPGMSGSKIEIKSAEPFEYLLGNPETLYKTINHVFRGIWQLEVFGILPKSKA